MNVKLFRPCADTLSLARVGKHDIRSRVLTLTFSGQPTHIAGFIVAIIINAVKGVARFTKVRQLTYVIMKSLKIMSPFSAYRDATSAIIGIRLSLGISTSPDNSRPSFVQGRFGQSMRFVRFADSLSQKTSARTGIAIAQSGKNHRRRFAAIALAEPPNLSVCIPINGTERDKTAKTLTGNIYGMTFEGDILGLHQKFLSVAKAGGVCSAARLFLLGCYRCNYTIESGYSPCPM